MFDNPPDDEASPDDKKAILDELIQYIQAHQGKDMSARLGKLPPAPPVPKMGDESEEAAEGDIPGVEADDDAAEPGAMPDAPDEAGPPGMDIEKLKMLLAKSRGG